MTTQPEFIAALTDAGYTLAHFYRKGDCLSVCVTPVDLMSDDTEQYTAFTVADALALQADCRIFHCLPDDVLVVSVDLPISEVGPEEEPEPIALEEEPEPIALEEEPAQDE